MEQWDVCIVGGGFTGLAAAYELVRRGLRPIILEADDEVGGLAGSFNTGDSRLEKFYHHWYNNDLHIVDLIDELGASDQLIRRTTRTGMYFANSFHRLSSPIDLLKFKPLSLFNRIRLGLLVLRARRVKHWTELEGISAEDWLIRLAGEKAYNIVWAPLMRGKFGPYASEISAVWIWNKLKLRGGSRGKSEAEVLVYYRGGFDALARKITTAIEGGGGSIKTSTPVRGLVIENGAAVAVQCADGSTVRAKSVLLTPALPIVSRLLQPHVDANYLNSLSQINYLANMCIVLELDRSLSQTYWLNVNDPGFPFVAVIEHTNFEPVESYGSRHIVYLSKYLPESDELFQMSQQQAFDFCLPHLKRIFPEFDRSWVQKFHVWRAQYSQPIVTRHYSRLIPPATTPIANVYIATMAQIYPEDRGTNYAVREGRKAAVMLAKKLGVTAA